MAARHHPSLRNQTVWSSTANSRPLWATSTFALFVCRNSNNMYLADPWGIERARVYEWTLTKLRFFNRPVSRARFTEIASEWIGHTSEQGGEGE